MTDTNVHCAECDAAMISDDGWGHLCPTCDVHDDCVEFPCSADGESGQRCVLNRPAAA